MQDIEQATRERAYQLWIESGCPDGHAEAHWLMAQREVLSVSLSEIGRVVASEPSTKVKKPKASRKKKLAA